MVVPNLYTVIQMKGEVHKCDCLKLMIQAYLLVAFFKIFFIKHVSLGGFF